MPEHEIKCAICHVTVVGFMKLSEGEIYPGDEKCSLICDPCIDLQNEEQVASN